MWVCKSIFMRETCKLAQNYLREGTTGKMPIGRDRQDAYLPTTSRVAGYGCADRFSSKKVMSDEQDGCAARIMIRQARCPSARTGKMPIFQPPVVRKDVGV